MTVDYESMSRTKIRDRPLRQTLLGHSRHPFVNPASHSSFRRRPESRGMGGPVVATGNPPTTRITVGAIRESPCVGVIDGPSPAGYPVGADSHLVTSPKAGIQGRHGKHQPAGSRSPRLPLDYRITAAGHRRHRGAEHSGGWGIGAGDGTRTRDTLLGRQELYQLSYSRAGAEGET